MLHASESSHLQCKSAGRCLNLRFRRRGKTEIAFIVEYQGEYWRPQEAGVAWNTVSSFKFKISQCADPTRSGGNIPCDQVQKYYHGTEGLGRWNRLGSEEIHVVKPVIQTPLLYTSSIENQTKAKTNSIWRDFI